MTKLVMKLYLLEGFNKCLNNVFVDTNWRLQTDILDKKELNGLTGDDDKKGPVIRRTCRE